MSKYLVFVGAKRGIKEWIKRLGKEADYIYVIDNTSAVKLFEDRAKRIYTIQTIWEKTQMWREVETVVRMGAESRYFVIFTENLTNNIELEAEWESNVVFLDRKNRVVALAFGGADAPYLAFSMRNAFSLKDYIGYILVRLGFEKRKVKERKQKRQRKQEQKEEGEQ